MGDEIDHSLNGPEQVSIEINCTDELTKAQDEGDSVLSKDHPKIYENEFRVSSDLRKQKDREDMSRITADAGLNTFGCVFLEVWVLSKKRTRLERPDGAARMDSAFRASLPNEELLTIADNLRSDAPDIGLGVGIPGTLFSDRSSGRVVQWRQLKSMIDDPFVQQEPTQRMKQIYGLGIGLIASTTFQFGVDSGIVIFYNRSLASSDQLRSDANERVMLDYTDFVGMSFAICKTREKGADMRRQLFEEAVRKVREDLIKKSTGAARGLDRLGSAILNKDKMEKLRDSMLEQIELEEAIEDAPDGCLLRLMYRLKKAMCNLYEGAVVRVTNSPRKWPGVNLHGPPRHSLSASIKAFVWVFVAMLMMLKLSHTISLNSAFALDGAWYSSTLCILFALTPAPVGQPRQIVLAHLWNMLVGIALQPIPTEDFLDFMGWGKANPDERAGMPLIWKQALAVALGVSGQAYMGILHPPATGLSLTFASHAKWSWGTMLSVLVADAVLIVVSVLMINLSEKGQYPMFWFGFGWDSGGTMQCVNKVANGLKRSIAKKKDACDDDDDDEEEKNIIGESV